MCMCWMPLPGRYLYSFNVARLRKSERLISSSCHGCFTISSPQLPAAATRFPSHGSGRPGLELRAATKLSSAGFEPGRSVVYESDALTTRPCARPAGKQRVCNSLSLISLSRFSARKNFVVCMQARILASPEIVACSQKPRVTIAL